jgi:hypothetical protein
MYLSFCAAVGCIILAMPPVLIGAIAKSTSLYRIHYDLIYISSIFRLEYDRL